LGRPRTASVGTPTNSPNIVEDGATWASDTRISSVRRGDIPSKTDLAPQQKGEIQMLKVLSAVGAVAVAAALLLPTASMASTPAADDQSTLVSYADLNLASQQGAETLRGRIREAAKDVCGLAGAAALPEIQFNRGCVAGAVALAQPGYDQAVASARHGIITVGTGASLIVSAPRQ
jgi:UrcA family protein